jgi:hypothetical protein
MTFDYAAAAASALDMLNRFGAPATLKRTTAGTYDPATGTATETVIDLATTAVVLAFPQKYIDGTLIRQGDRRALCAPGVEPKAGDRFAWQGVEYTVIGATPIAPAGVAVLFEAQIRGG